MAAPIIKCGACMDEGRNSGENCAWRPMFPPGGEENYRFLINYFGRPRLKREFRRTPVEQRPAHFEDLFQDALLEFAHRNNGGVARRFRAMEQTIVQQQAYIQFLLGQIPNNLQLQLQQANPQLNLNPPHPIGLQNQQAGLGQQVGIFQQVNPQLNLNPPHHIGLQKQEGMNEHVWPPNDQFGIALQDQQPGIGQQDGVFQQVNPQLNLNPPHPIGLQNQQAGLGQQVGIFQQVNPQLNLNPPHHIGLQKQEGMNEHVWPPNDQFGFALQDQQPGIGQQDGVFQQVNPQLNLNPPHPIGLQNQQAGLGQQVGIFQQVNPQLNLNPPRHIGLQKQEGMNEHVWPPNDQFGIALQDQQPGIGQQDGVFQQVNPQLNLDPPHPIGLQNQQAGLGQQVGIFQQVNPQLNLNPPRHIGLQKQEGMNEHVWPPNDQFGIALQDQQPGIGQQDGVFQQVNPQLNLNPPHPIGLQNQQAGLGQQVGIFQQVNPQLNLNPPRHIGLQKQEGMNEHVWPPNDQFGIALQDQQPGIGQQDGVFQQVNPQLNLNPPHPIGLQQQDGINEHGWPPNDQFGGANLEGFQ
ncbi:hypothetical protein P3L10_007336 [Capsicum annuum]